MRRRDVQPIYAETYRRRVKAKRVIFGLFLSLMVVMAGFFAWHWHAQQELKKYPIRGVSIDQGNGYIDFESLKTHGVKFVYLKATQGAAYTDDSFLSNFQRSQGSQLPVGVYHYFSFTSSAAAQFRNFVREVKTNTGSLPICITVQYYGTFDDGNLNWKKVRKRIHKLSSDLQRYYQRPILISATRDMMQHLKFEMTGKRQFWTMDGNLGQPNADATFIQVSQSQSFRLDKQVVFLPMAVFNGNRRQWSRYLDRIQG